MKTADDTFDISKYMGETNLARQPPWSDEAEQAVLGAILLDSIAYDAVGDLLVETDFYAHQHRLIFAAMAALVMATKAVDVITVHDRLKRMPKGDQAGDMAYLHSLTESIPSASSARRHAEIVRDKARERALIAALDSAAAIAWQAGDATEKIDKVAALIAKLETQQRNTKEPVSFDRLVVDLVDRVNELHENGAEAITGVATGLAALDVATRGLQPGHLVVLAARTTVGKTSLAGQIALSVSRTGLPVLFLSQEMGNGEVALRAVANLGGIDLGRLQTGALLDDEWGALSHAVQVGGAECRLYVDDQSGLTLMDVRAKARALSRRVGGQLGLVVIDYLQLMSSTLPAERRHHQIEQISRGLKVLAKDLRAPVLLLSQLSRDSTKRSEPELTDLKESGAIEEDADVVLLLHPWSRASSTELTVLLKVAKNRGGKRGRLALTFEGATQRWSGSNADVAPRARGET